MITRPPFIDAVERAHGDLVGDVRRCEDEVELTCRCCRRLPRVTVGRHVSTAFGQLVSRRIGSPTLGRLRSDENEAHRLGTVEDRLVPRSPVDVAVLAVPIEHIEVTGEKDSVVAAPRDERRDVRQQSMDGGVREQEV